MACILGKNGCGGQKCATCGMDTQEMERREKLIRSNGLSKNENGLYYLDLRRKKENA